MSDDDERRHRRNQIYRVASWCLLPLFPLLVAVACVFAVSREAAGQIQDYLERLELWFDR